MNRVQRGFHRIGIVAAAAIFLLVVVIGLGSRATPTDYSNYAAKKLSRLLTADCETGAADLFSNRISEQQQKELVTCIKLGDGEILKYPPDTYAKQVEKAKDHMTKRQEALLKAQQRLLVYDLMMIFGGGLLSALVAYGIFASIGWALAGFAKG